MSDVDQRFAPPNAHVEDVAVAGEAELASRGMRFLGAMIDGVLALGVVLVLNRIPGLSIFSLGASENPMGFHVGTMLFGFVVFLVLQGWLLITRAQTIGKVLCGMRIVRSDGSKPDAVRLISLRYGVGYLLNAWGLLGSVYALIDCLLIFRESRKCLHDTIADTKVIKL